VTPPAVGALTGHSREDLARWLREVQKVAALTGDAALSACDVFLWSYREWAGRSADRDTVPSDPQEGSEPLDDRAYATWLIAEDLGRLRETMDRLRRQQAIPGSMPIWEPESLRQRAAAVGHLAGPEARAAAAEDIAQARQEAEALAAELDVSVHRQAIQAAGERPIVSSATVAAILGAVDRALAGLVKLGQVSDADRETARQAKLRAARYRSERRLAEAEVAAAGGNLKKAERLRREAGVMLQHDLRAAHLEPAPPTGTG
jgi:hypothetical protein